MTKQIRTISSIYINGLQQTIFNRTLQTDLILDDLENVAITTPTNGDVLKFNGTDWINSASGGGGGITSLNGLTAASQTFVNDTNINVVSASSTHTITWAGILAIARGGTSFNTYTIGDTIYSSATNVLSKLPIGSSGQVLTVSGGIPVWSAPASGAIVIDSTAITSGTAGRILFESSSNKVSESANFTFSTTTGLFVKTSTDNGNVQIRSWIESPGTYGAIYLGNITPDNTNASLGSNGSNTYLCGGASGNINFTFGGSSVNLAQMNTTRMLFNSGKKLSFNIDVPTAYVAVNPLTTVDTLADVSIGITGITRKGLVIQGITSQSGNLFEAQPSTGASSINTVISATGSIGINISTPTTLLDIGAGTAILAPIHLNSGTLNTGTNRKAGNIERLTTRLYFTTTDNTTQETLAFLSDIGSGGITIGTTTITSGTSNRILYDSSAVVSESANLTFDGTNMGVGTAPISLTRLGIKGVSTATTDFALKINDSSNNQLFQLNNAGNSAFGVVSINTSYRVRISGIGSTLATDALVVETGGGAVSMVVDDEGNTAVGPSGGPTGVRFFIKGATSDSTKFLLRANDSTNNVKHEIDNTGNTGIGVASNSSIRLFSKGVDTSTSNYAASFQNSNNTVYQDIRNDGRIVFGDVSNVYMGIGTSNAGAVSTIRLGIWGVGTTSGTYALQVHDSTGGSNTLVVRNDGAVGASGTLIVGGVINSPTTVFEVKGQTNDSTSFVFSMNNASATSGVHLRADGRWGSTGIKYSFGATASFTLTDTRLYVKGDGTGSTTFGLRIADSAGADNFLFRDSGVFVMKQGQSNSTANAGGVIFDQFANRGNTTTTETDLYINTISGNSLGTNGDKICSKYGGFFVASATATRELKVYFAGTVIFDSGALTHSTAFDWEINVTIIRVSSTVVRYVIAGVDPSLTSVGELTGLTLSSNNDLKITGQAGGTGAATNDIIAQIGYGEWKSAFN